MKTLKNSELVWSTLSTNEQKRDPSYQIIYDNKILYPWKLIRKNL